MEINFKNIGLNKQNKIILTSFGLFSVAVGVFFGGYILGKNSIYLNPDEYRKQQYVLENSLKEFKSIDLTTLWQVWDKIDKDYLDGEINHEELYYGVIKGLVSSLDDRYSSFLTPEEAKAEKEVASGQLEGIGVTLRQEEQYVVIESVVDGFPADKSGVKNADIVIAVDDQDMLNKTATEVATKIRGKAGTTVKLKIYRDSEKKDVEFNIVRDKIDVDNIVLGENRNGVQVIKVYKFTESSVESFKKIWDEVASKVNNSNTKAIIIDLRGNPGGYVAGVEYMLEDFLPKGSILYHEENNGGIFDTAKSTRDPRLANKPLVVIVNGGSASASEIFAGAIQDHNRGVVIGEKTVGKGVEQKVYKFEDGSQLNLVFQRWLTPNKRQISMDNPIIPSEIIEKYNDQTEKAFNLLLNK